MSSTEAIAGVLIGGRSTRMGRCKALLPYQGATFLDRTVSVASSAVEEVVLLGGIGFVPPLPVSLRHLEDEPGQAGPLAGLYSLLEYARDRWALLIACDMPLIDTVILRRLLDACDASVDAVAFRVPGEHGDTFPCVAAFHPRLAPEVRAELAGSASLRSLIARVRRRLLEANDWEARCLRSFNTPQEYAALVGPESKLAEAAGCAR